MHRTVFLLFRLGLRPSKDNASGCLLRCVIGIKITEPLFCWDFWKVFFKKVVAGTTQEHRGWSDDAKDGWKWGYDGIDDENP